MSKFSWLYEHDSVCGFSCLVRVLCFYTVLHSCDHCGSVVSLEIGCDYLYLHYFLYEQMFDILGFSLKHIYDLRSEGVLVLLLFELCDILRFLGLSWCPGLGLQCWTWGRSGCFSLPCLRRANPSLSFHMLAVGLCGCLFIRLKKNLAFLTCWEFFSASLCWFLSNVLYLLRQLWFVFWYIFIFFWFSLTSDLLSDFGSHFYLLKIPCQLDFLFIA